MATSYSVQKTKWDQNTPKTRIKPNEHGGRGRSSYALYEASTALLMLMRTVFRSRSCWLVPLLQAPSN